MNDEKKLNLAIMGKIRPIDRKDLPEILRIEQDSYEFSWSEDDLIRHLRDRNCGAYTYLFDNNIAGFMLFERDRGQLNLVNIAIDSQYRRNGIGTEMVDILKSSIAQDSRRSRIEAEVREKDLRAQKFLSSLDFRATRVLWDLYEDTSEDGYLMEFSKKPSGVYVPKNRISEHLKGKPLW